MLQLLMDSCELVWLPSIGVFVGVPRYQVYILFSAEIESAEVPMQCLQGIGLIWVSVNSDT